MRSGVLHLPKNANNFPIMGAALEAQAGYNSGSHLRYSPSRQRLKNKCTAAKETEPLSARLGMETLYLRT